MDFSKTLLTWYDGNKRVLPFRGETEPYRIWLSEIMLQQTQTTTVAGYYTAFVQKFPTVFDLAAADEDAVLKLWEGLGYYARARNLHKTAKIVAGEMQGVFPKDAAGLLTLPGIGPYAANAIASIAYNECVPALDGNQARVLTRVLACDLPIRTPFDLLEQANALMDRERPGDYNQALMDLGAGICSAKKPRCEACPVSKLCKAYEEGDPESFPKKVPPIAKRNVPMSVFVVIHDGKTYVRKRPDKGLLGGLYEFPMAEGEQTPDKLSELGFTNIKTIRTLPDAKHVFTHLVWQMKGRLVDAVPTDGSWIAVEDLETVAMPTALKVYRQIAQEVLLK